jgi:5'-nucleotidase
MPSWSDVRRRLVAGALGAALLVTGCSDDGDDGADGGEAAPPSTTEATTTTEAEVLDVLVSNDDGYAAEGIDVLVEALRAEPSVEVTVVAPAEDRSGSGDQTTPGEVATQEVETASGYPAVAVEGFPADTINVALDQLDVAPDLVVSGINEGQNLGPVVQVSGTVGAARTAGRRGIPALAVSQGLADTLDYDVGVEFALDWVRERRDELDDQDEPAAEPVPVANLNVPSCATGDVRGQVEVPAVQDTTLDQFQVDCTSTETGQPDDVGAFTAGYATLSEVDPG